MSIRSPFRTLWLLVAILATSAAAWAEEAGIEALVLSVPSPITAETPANLRKRIVDASHQDGFRPRAIIFDFDGVLADR